MELVFNLIWVLLACGSLLAWTLARRDADSTSLPAYSRGLVILACILFVLFPVISISDDVAQTPALTEDVTLKDALKGTKSPDFVQVLQPAAVAGSLMLIASLVFWRETHKGEDPPRLISVYDPNIENRPPPQPFFA